MITNVVVTSLGSGNFQIHFNTSLTDIGDINAIQAHFGPDMSYGQTANGQALSTNPDGSVACVISLSYTGGPLFHYTITVTDFSSNVDTYGDAVYFLAVGYEAQLFAAVVDILKTAGPGLKMPISADRIFQVNTPQSNAQLPALAVRFPSAPYDTGSWATSGNKRNALFVVEVGIITGMQSDGVHPYGDNQTPGILILTQDVKNALENSFDTFRAACPTFVDFQLTTTFYQNETVGNVSATVTISFNVRFIAGNR